MTDNQKRPNLIFILVDALRFDRLGCYGYPLSTSPNLDRLATTGWRFQNHFCCMSTSSPALTSIFSGLQPRTHGIFQQGKKLTESEIAAFYQRKIKLLPELLKEHGYRTYGFDWLGDWHERGYDYYEGLKVDTRKGREQVHAVRLFLEKIKVFKTVQKLYRSQAIKSLFSRVTKTDVGNMDPVLTEKALQIIKTETQPFFLFIHYNGTHMSYKCPKKYFKQFYDKNSGTKTPLSFEHIKNERLRQFYLDQTEGYSYFEEIKARYDGAVRYIDDQIGLLLTALKSAGKEQDTVVVVTADHGEILTEHGITFCHHGLYEEVIKVPLIIAGPSITAKTISALVQHVDLVPTLLNLLQIHTTTTFDGFNLQPLMNGTVSEVRDYVYTEEQYMMTKNSIRTRKYKLITAENEPAATCSMCGIVHGGINELYDLEHDPQELNNLYDQQPEIVVALRQKLNHFLARMDLEKIKQEQQKLTQAISHLNFKI